MKEYKVILKALDNKVITKKTGKTSVLAKCYKLPNENDYVCFWYLEELNSPGVSIETNNVTRIGSIILFEDNQKRPFQIIITDI